eukprot:scaffold18449_cov27-Tisochrysis_lutea.AAC.1
MLTVASSPYDANDRACNRMGIGRAGWAEDLRGRVSLSAHAKDRERAAVQATCAERSRNEERRRKRTGEVGPTKGGQRVSECVRASV